MEQALLAMLGVSLSASIFIVLLLVLSRVLGRRYTARLRVALWLLVAVRLLLPFNLSVAGQPVQLAVPVEMTRPAMGAPVLPDAAPLPEGGAAGGIAPADVAGGSFSPLEMTAAVWLAGAALVLLANGAGWLRFSRRVRRFSGEAAAEDRRLLAETAEELGIKRLPALRRCSLIQSPMLLGFFRPILLLPVQAVEGDSLRLMLRHELVHLRRGDVGAKAVLLLAAALHWYNPLVWVMLRRANADMELACDEAVVEDLDRGQRAAYGQLILDGAAGKRTRAGVLAVSFASRGTLKTRLQGLFDLRAKKRGAAVLAAFILVMALAGSLVACAPKADGGSLPPAVSTPAPGPAVSQPAASQSAAPGPASAPQPAPAEMETIKTDDGQTWYVVETETQLRSIAYSDETLARRYIQDGNIELTGEWLPIGNEEHPFTGVYSGNGYHISGLRVTSPDAHQAGLFGHVENGTVYNVTLMRPDVSRSGASTVGPVVAFSYGDSGRTFDNIVLMGEKPAGARGEVVTWDGATVRLYEDGYPYIKDNFTNHTEKAIQGYSYAMLPYDAEGNPLKIVWGFDAEEAPTYDNVCEIDADRGPESAYYVAPGETFDVRGGWSIFETVDEAGDCPVAYVLLSFRDITFADGTTWTNPDYQAWLDTYRGKPVEVKDLQEYYPYSQAI